MKVLVTGAGGYIGRHVVKYLLDDNMEVRHILAIFAIHEKLGIWNLMKRTATG